MSAPEQVSSTCPVAESAFSLLYASGVDAVIVPHVRTRSDSAADTHLLRAVDALLDDASHACSDGLNRTFTASAASIDAALSHLAPARCNCLAPARCPTCHLSYSAQHPVADGTTCLLSFAIFAASPVHCSLVGILLQLLCTNLSSLLFCSLRREWRRSGYRSARAHALRLCCRRPPAARRGRSSW